MESDYILVHKMRNGDERAMEIFVGKYYSDILNYCHYRTWDLQVAEDLTQDVFANFFRRLPMYKHRGKLANYLYTIAGNVCKDYHRGKKEWPISVEEGRIAGVLREKGENDPAGRWAARMDIKEAVGKLPEEFQEVIVFRYFMDMKQKDIARVCGISLPLVKYRLKQAKDKLITLLEDKEEGKHEP
ncbi:MAG: RNA polymerase sigma factor [Anaerovoracaceae bacterium]|jgi:RNA polymerase sigma factor (sigma-70 family)